MYLLKSFFNALLFLFAIFAIFVLAFFVDKYCELPANSYSVVIPLPHIVYGE